MIRKSILIFRNISQYWLFRQGKNERADWRNYHNPAHEDIRFHRLQKR